MSITTKKESANPNATPSDRRRYDAVRRAFGGHLADAGSAGNPRSADEFAFHMTDWLEEFERLREMFDQPERFSREQWRDALFAFLSHASGHLLRAAELAGALSDPFDVLARRQKSTPVTTVALPRRRKSA
jgi:hypothetical protein